MSLPRLSLHPGCRLGFVLLLGCWCLAMALLGEAVAQEAVIDELTVTTTSTDLLVFASVRDAFSPEMEKAVKSGIPVSFGFSVELSKNRTAWLNQEIVAIELEHTLSYDTLKDEFTVFRSELAGQSLHTKSLTEARLAMSQVNGLLVLPLKGLQTDEQYRLRARARLLDKGLPASLHGVVPLWGPWDFKTDWRVVEFRY
ncbi:MAG: DUF4390 domain-containing protein [Thermodesulfobacteriota bacterium]